MSEVKELNFFTTDGTWNKGVEWYESNFDPSARVRGESSTGYTRGQNAVAAAERARHVLDDIKLIYMVRDPIERVRSDYHHHRAVGLEARGFAEALDDPANPYVQASRYASQLEPYLRCFGSQNILVETQEHLYGQRRDSLARIFRFLEVDDKVDLAEFDRLWEQSEGKNWMFSMGSKLRRRGVRLPRALRWSAQRLQRSRVMGGRAGGLQRPEVNTRQSAVLVECLKPEVSALRELTGMSFSDWSV
jgi:hypothetical protein